MISNSVVSVCTETYTPHDDTMIESFPAPRPCPHGRMSLVWLAPLLGQGVKDHVRVGSGVHFSRRDSYAMTGATNPTRPVNQSFTARSPSWVFVRALQPGARVNMTTVCRAASALQDCSIWLFSGEWGHRAEILSAEGGTGEKVVGSGGGEPKQSACAPVPAIHVTIIGPKKAPSEPTRVSPSESLPDPKHRANSKALPPPSLPSRDH